MEFRYASYEKMGLIWPLAMLLPMIVDGIWVLVLYLKGDWASKKLEALIATGSVCVYLFFINGGLLLNGGIHLLYEKETDAVVYEGTLTGFRFLGMEEMPKLRTEYKSEAAYGVSLQIDDITCKAPTRGLLLIGDRVKVTYLPRSGYVLALTRSDGDTAPLYELRKVDTWTSEKFRNTLIASGISVSILLTTAVCVYIYYKRTTKKIREFYGEHD